MRQFCRRRDFETVRDVLALFLEERSGQRLQRFHHGIAADQRTDDGKCRSAVCAHCVQQPGRTDEERAVGCTGKDGVLAPVPPLANGFFEAFDCLYDLLFRHFFFLQLLNRYLDALQIGIHRLKFRDRSIFPRDGIGVVRLLIPEFCQFVVGLKF